MRRRTLACWLLSAVLVAGAAAAAPVSTPSEDYQELFAQVQLERVFADSKTFADATAKMAPAEVMKAYRAASRQRGFNLRSFVVEHFALPVEAPVTALDVSGRTVEQHIDRLWSLLERSDARVPPHASLLALPHRYVVPGGRFTELYYWDSYFTMLGLEQSGRHDLAVDMLRNFAWLIDQYGHIPNGSRSYYLSRSQPPFFAFMVELVAERDGESVYRTYLPQLKREHAYWMEGQDGLANGAAHRRVVRLADGALLNRYWDDRDTPRDESYREDVETARQSARPAAEVYRDLRAAAESGWDFSSRWLKDGVTLATIRTTELIPPDLNSLLYKLEQTIAKGCALSADQACTAGMVARASARRSAMTRYLWNAELGAFTDYDWPRAVQERAITAATLYPLFVRASSPAQAGAVARVVRAQLLAPRGLSTTTVFTGQQWDAPNGWAPLQWIAVMGLRSYGQAGLAAAIAQRWTQANLELYRRRGRLVEKYNVEKPAVGRAGEPQTADIGVGGEYPTQDGFGWSNGVLRKLLALYPASKQARTAPPSPDVAPLGGKPVHHDQGTR